MGSATIKFDVYGRFQIEVHREADVWVAYRIALGKRMRIDDLAIPGKSRRLKRSHAIWMTCITRLPVQANRYP